MTFSKSASLCDTDALTLMSLQTQDVKSEASLRKNSQELEKVCLSWRWSQQLCIVHCTLCGLLSLQTVFPGQEWASRGARALCAHWGIRRLEVT